MPESKRILNVGCGKDTYGTDFVDVYPVREGVLKCNLEEENLPYPKDTFDEVYAKFVFEHMKDPNTFLKRMRYVMKDGGRLILMTDNAGCWVFHSPVKFLYARQHYENEVREGNLDRHYALYTPMHIENHLAAAGFRDAKAEYMWFENKTTTLKNGVLFGALTAFARILSFVLPKKTAYPHIRATATK